MIDLAIKEVKVGERMRKSFEDIDALAESIRVFGQIEPIVLDENNQLIAGERRLRATIQLRRETIKVIYIHDLSEVQKKEIELEENIQRKDFTWQEEVNAKFELHKLKQSIHGAAVQGAQGKAVSNDGKWHLKDTAIALGESVGSVSMDIQLAKGMMAFPELLKEKNKHTAFKRLQQERGHILNEELAKRITRTNTIQHPDVICGNCIEEMQKMETASVDLILTDPPYGIEVGESQTYKRMTISDVNFVDTDFDTFDLLDKAFKEMFRVLKNNRHAYIFFAIDKYTAVVNLLTKHGFEVHHIPIIWDKGSGSYPSQMTTYVHSYEPILHCWKGSRKLNGTPRNIFTIKRVPSSSKIHPTQKPTELLRDIINLSTSPGELVFDPFAGSGATIIAAKESQRRAIGIELNPIYHANICIRLEGKEVPKAETAKQEEVDPDLVEENSGEL